MNCIFLYNPVSGRGRVAKKLDRIVRSLGEKYESVDVYATTGRGDMTRAVREAATKYDAIVFAGGDGTVNEAVQGVCEAGTDPELGYIPTGTVNDVAHSLGIPKNIRRALKVIRSGKTVPLDCMKVNDRYAMYVVAAGAFTSSSYTTPQTQKQRVGRLAYGIEGLRKNMKFDAFDVCVQSGDRREQTECVLLLLVNGKYVAGMHVNKYGSMTDGKIEAAIIRQHKKANFFGRVRAFFAIVHLFLYGYKVRERNITRIEGSHFEIDAGENVVWNFDGEKGISGKVTVDVVPARVRMIASAKKKDI